MPFKLQEKGLFSLHESTALQLKVFRKYSVPNKQRFKFHLKALPNVWSCSPTWELHVWGMQHSLLAIGSFGYSHIQQCKLSSPGRCESGFLSKKHPPGVDLSVDPNTFSTAFCTIRYVKILPQHLHIDLGRKVFLDNLTGCAGTAE